MFDGLLHVIYADDGTPMIANETPDTADNLSVVEDEPSPERIAEVLRGAVSVYPEEQIKSYLGIK